ncbi:MAG: inositol monophosphatase, partial [bacterium]
MSIPEVLIEKNHPAEPLAHLLWLAHQHARGAVRKALAERHRSEMASVAAQAAMDTIYGIDVVAETALLQFLDEHQREAPAFLLVGEFEQGEVLPFGHGAPPFRVLLDPIDGTRLLMHQKSSGWILAGIAPEKGDDTRLGDIFFSLQTELPPLKQVYADTLWT